MEHSGQRTEQPEPKCWGQTALTNQRGFQPRAASWSSGSALGFLPDLLLLAKIQQQQLHMLPLFSEWARIKGEVLKRAMCVLFVLLPVKYHHGFWFSFFKKILIAENTRGEGIIGKSMFVLWYLQREDSCCSIISHDFREVLHCTGWKCNLQENANMLKSSCQWKRYFVPLWISIWKVLQGTGVDRMINFYCNFETKCASWHTVIPILNQFKMDLEGAHLGLPCLAQRECVEPSLNFTSGVLRWLHHWKTNYIAGMFSHLKCNLYADGMICTLLKMKWELGIRSVTPEAKLEENEPLEWQRSRIIVN